MNYLKNIYDTIVDNPCTAVFVYFICSIVLATIIGNDEGRDNKNKKFDINNKETWNDFK